MSDSGCIPAGSGSGSPGPPGADGDDGQDGPAGPPGIAGAAGATGPAGTPGASVQGPPGQDGADGEDGEPGPRGLTGATGATGARGDTGATGATGPQGPPGQDGADGEDGEPGPQGPPVSTVGLPGTDGWIASVNAYVFVSNTSGVTTFKVSGVDVTTTLYPGVLVGWSDSGTLKYGVIATATFSTDTTVTLISNTDYTMGATPLVPRYSIARRPAGFPARFNYDTAPSGFSVIPTSAFGDWTTDGTSIVVSLGALTNGTTTGGATFPTWRAPVARSATTNGQSQFTAAITDGGTAKTTPGLARVNAGTAVIDIFTDYAGGTWAVGGAGRCRSTSLVYPFG